MNAITIDNYTITSPIQGLNHDDVFIMENTIDKLRLSFFEIIVTFRKINENYISKYNNIPYCPGYLFSRTETLKILKYL